MRRSVFLFSIVIVAGILATQIRAQFRADVTRDQVAIMKVDEEFRLAKLANNTSGLERVLSPGFLETNQNRNSRNKQQFIDLFNNFPIGSLTTDEYHVRISGDVGFVTGSQTEDGSQMFFMRGYVRNGEGWQLLSSMQFHKPQ